MNNYKEVSIHYKMKNYRYQKVYHVVHKKVGKVIKVKQCVTMF